METAGDALAMNANQTKAFLLALSRMVELGVGPVHIKENWDELEKRMVLEKCIVLTFTDEKSGFLKTLICKPDSPTAEVFEHLGILKK